MGLREKLEDETIMSFRNNFRVKGMENCPIISTIIVRR